LPTGDCTGDEPVWAGQEEKTKSVKYFEKTGQKKKMFREIPVSDIQCEKMQYQETQRRAQAAQERPEWCCETCLEGA
jgi:hypothetical protein